MAFSVRTLLDSLRTEGGVLHEKLRSRISSLASTKVDLPSNEESKDVFTQEATPDIFFVLERDNGTAARVDAARFVCFSLALEGYRGSPWQGNSLIDYILASGDYNDPETRQPFSEETLIRIDIFGKRLGKPSVLKARHDRATEFSEQRLTRDALFALENIAGECVSQLYDTLESVNDGKESQDQAVMRLLVDVVPGLEDAFKQMLAIDPEAARICASQFDSFLRGPLKTPNPGSNEISTHPFEHLPFRMRSKLAIFLVARAKCKSSMTLMRGCICVALCFARCSQVIN